MPIGIVSDEDTIVLLDLVDDSGPTATRHRDALIEGGDRSTHLRPILMTAIATILALESRLRPERATRSREVAAPARDRGRGRPPARLDVPDSARRAGGLLPRRWPEELDRG